MKKRIIAIVLSVITIISVCAIAMTSASAAVRSYPHQNYRSNETSSVSVTNDAIARGEKVGFFRP